MRLSIAPMLLCGLAVSAFAEPPPDGKPKVQARCVIKLTVTAEGNIENPSVETSSGYPRVDAACLGQHMQPSLVDGHPVERTVLVPITWKPTSKRTETARQDSVSATGEVPNDILIQELDHILKKSDEVPPGKTKVG
jgi:hypothetical protein